MWTGRRTDANKLLKPYPIFQAFLEAHPNSFESMMYTKTKKRAGMHAHVYPSFRDHILPIALRELRAAGKSIEEVPPTEFVFKKQTMSSGEPMARAVVGWECAPS